MKYTQHLLSSGLQFLLETLLHTAAISKCYLLITNSIIDFNEVPPLYL